MSTAPPKKICGLCGEDCSGRPRIKDPKGHYYCMTCYEEALERRKATAPTSPPPDPVRETSDSPDDLSGVLSAPPVSQEPCPGCGGPLAGDAVLCTNCGYDRRTGQILHVTAPTVAAAEGTAPSAWPIVVGVISLIFSAGGLLLHTVGALLDGSSASAQPDEAHQASYFVGQLVGAGTAILFSLCLGIGGAGVLMRRRWGALLLKIWAAVKAILASLCFWGGLGLLLAMGFSGPVRENFGLGVGIAIAIMVLVYAWFMAWPVFVILLFRGDKIRAEVAAWG